MEIMGNSSRLNDSEGQVASSNYNFHISQDLNLGGGTSARIGKSEADIGLLVACKVQLSSEVIRWKTESLRLQKERDSIHQRNQDLDQTVAKLASRTQELESKLMQAEAENGQLKSRSVAIDVEKAALVNKLSQNFNKYHSFPWSDVSSKLTCSRAEQKKVPDVLQDDWREVSQKMLQQMKLEMKELQEMSSRFCSEDKEVTQPEAVVEESKDELEEGISSLQSETKSIKCHLLKQRQKLQHLLSSFSSAGHQKGVTNTTLGHLDIATPSVENSESKPKPSCSRLNRLSDENYRHYFTKQLGTSCDLSKISKEMQHILKNQEVRSVHDLPPENRQKFKGPIPKQPEKQVADEPRCTDVREPRVCPICQLTFDVSISQEDFEQHVVNHLETESASLLDQYVVI